MGKDNKILFIGAAAVIGYMLAPKEAKEQLKNLLPSGGGSSQSLDLTLGNGENTGGIMPESFFKAFTDGISQILSEIPNNALPNQSPQLDPNIPKLDPNIPSWLPEWLPDIPSLPRLPHVEPVLPSLPQIPKLPTPEGMNFFPDLFPFDITMPENQTVRNVLSATGSVLGKQYVGAALTGTHLVRPLPFASYWEAAWSPVRESAKKVAGTTTAKKVFPVVADDFFRKAAKGGIKVVTQGADSLIAREAIEAVGKKTIGQTLGKVAPKAAAITGVKLGARAIPVVGWGLLLADGVADLARVFGATPPDWLGFSPIVEVFTGSNPIEDWAKQTEQEKAILNKNINSESGSGYTYQPTMALVDPVGTLGRLEASVGQPEAPTKSEKEYTFSEPLLG
tara:strand:+ start:65 stop:1243 length:1179 start_codon:yes stop_codon:yes gene_type:complete